MFNCDEFKCSFVAEICADIGVGIIGFKKCWGPHYDFDKSFTTPLCNGAWPGDACKEIVYWGVEIPFIGRIGLMAIDLCLDPEFSSDKITAELSKSGDAEAGMN